MLCWHDIVPKTVFELFVYPLHLHLFPEKTTVVISESGLINLNRFLVLFGILLITLNTWLEKLRSYLCGVIFCSIHVIVIMLFALPDWCNVYANKKFEIEFEIWIWTALTGRPIISQFARHDAYCLVYVRIGRPGILSPAIYCERQRCRGE